MPTDEKQAVETPETKNTVENQTVETQTTETKTEANNTAISNEPYKTFASKEDFDRHSAGILNSAKNKAEKELLALLGLKPDEKDKLAKFKEAYDNTLSESEKQAKNLENLNNEVNQLKSEIAEKDAVISALSQITGKKPEDVAKYVKMAKGLVDENTTIEQALEQVFSFTKAENTKSVPIGKPLNEPSDSAKGGDNPFKTGNWTEQGKLIKTDREKAREMFFAVYGKAPSW